MNTKMNLIVRRLREKIKTERRILPLICYALDSNIITEDEYESLKGKDAIGGDISGLGALLIFIRNFFECSNGVDIWKSTPWVRRGKIVEQMKRSYPNMFNNHGLNKPYQWTASQCWFLKRSGSSRLIKNNRYIYQMLSFCSIFDLAHPWHEINGADYELTDLDSETQDELESFLETEPYLKYIWDNYKKEYLMSLRAIVSPRNVLDEVDNWLKPLVGLAPSSVKCNYDWKLLTRNDKSLSPALVLSPEFRDAKIKQGYREALSTSGVYHVWYLIENGFNLNEEIDIILDEKVVFKISSPIVQQGMLFRSRNNKEILLEDSFICGGSFYLFYLSTCDAPRVSIDMVPVTGVPIENVPQ